MIVLLEPEFMCWKLETCHIGKIYWIVCGQIDFLHDPNGLRGRDVISFCSVENFTFVNCATTHIYCLFVEFVCVVEHKALGY